jgi:nitrogen fixation protein FixH
MFKLSWGYIAAIFFLSFVVFILGLAYLAMRENFELVAPDYYAQELKYQHKIDAAQNTEGLQDATQITLDKLSVTIDLPKEFDGKNVSGQVYFFRPSDASKDLRFSISVDRNGQQKFKSDKFIKGLYRIKIDWQNEGKNYFVERSIFLKN